MKLRWYLIVPLVHIPVALTVLATLFLNQIWRPRDRANLSG